MLVTLCLATLASAALPAFALTGSDTHDEDLTYIGVRARCTSSLTLIKATGTLSLSYLPGYSNNYLPEDDYVCKVKLTLEYSDGGSVTPPYEEANGMLVTNSFSHINYRNGNYTCTKATYKYYVIGTKIYTEVIQ